MGPVSLTVHAQTAVCHNNCNVQKRTTRRAKEEKTEKTRPLPTDKTNEICSSEFRLRLRHSEAIYKSNSCDATASKQVGKSPDVTKRKERLR